MSRIGPLWLNKLVDEAGFDTFDEFVAKMKSHMLNRTIADSTLNTYCTTAYAALIDRAKITTRPLMPGVKLHDLYKKWVVAQRTAPEDRSAEETALLATPFFRPTWEKKLSLNVFRAGGVQKVLRESKHKLVDKPALNISQPQEFMNTILSGLVSTDPASMFTALLLCSGRRASTFILHPNAFEPTDDPEDYECFYTEYLKVGLSASERRKIPLLAPYTFFRECLDNFVLSQKQPLESRKCCSAMELQARFGKQYNRWVKKRTGGFKPHDLRSMYAAFCIRLYCGAMDPVVYIHKSLAHKSDLSTALHYSRVNLLHNDLQEWVPQVDDKTKEFVIAQAYRWGPQDGVGKKQSQIEEDQEQQPTKRQKH